MRFALGVTLAVALIALHCGALYALLHPKVSPEYRAYYIDRNSTDWRVQHYPVTPAEGMQFSKSGWPDFVSRSYGISNVEPFGRWTDTRLGLTAGFEFQRAFSGHVCVVIRARPSDALRGKTVAVAFGDRYQQINFGSGDDFRSYAVDFDLTTPATFLAVQFPRHLPRHSHANPREPGIALQRLQIFEVTCSQLPEAGRGY